MGENATQSPQLSEVAASWLVHTGARVIPNTNQGNCFYHAHAQVTERADPPQDVRNFAARWAIDNQNDAGATCVIQELLGDKKPATTVHIDVVVNAYSEH